MITLKKNHIKIDKLIVFFLCSLLIISLLSIYSASIYLSKSLGNLVLKQGLWYFIGTILIILVLKLKVNFFIKYAPYLYIFCNILLLGLLFIAPEINGSKCWYVIDGLGSFQPSEFMKIGLLFMEIYIIDKYKVKYKNLNSMQEFKLILLIFLVFLIPSVLTFLEPDTGAVIIYFIMTVIVLLICGIKFRWFSILGIISSFLMMIFFFLYFNKQNMFIKYFGSDFFYRIDRIINWRSGSGMQLENSLAAIGSSGLFGHGFNKTPIYFPEAGTDFIFTVFASNFGLIGCTFIITITVFFDIHLIKIALNQKKEKYKYLLSGIICIFFYQQIQNISMTIGLLPITGITLPFISYGGSSLLAYLFLIGTCLSVYNESNI